MTEVQTEPEQAPKPGSTEQEPILEDLNVLSPTGDLAIAQINEEIAAAVSDEDHDLLEVLILEKGLIQHADAFGIIIGASGSELNRAANEFANSNKPNPYNITDLADGVRRRAERASQARWEMLGIKRKDVAKSLDLEEALAAASQDLEDASAAGEKASDFELLMEKATNSIGQANAILAEHKQSLVTGTDSDSDNSPEQLLIDEDLSVKLPDSDLAARALRRLIEDTEGDERFSLKQQLNDIDGDQSRTAAQVELGGRLEDKARIIQQFAMIERWHIVVVDPETINEKTRHLIETAWSAAARSQERATRDEVEAKRKTQEADDWLEVANTLLRG